MACFPDLGVFLPLSVLHATEIAFYFITDLPKELQWLPSAHHIETEHLSKFSSVLSNSTQPTLNSHSSTRLTLSRQVSSLPPHNVLFIIVSVVLLLIFLLQSDDPLCTPPPQIIQFHLYLQDPCQVPPPPHLPQTSPRTPVLVKKKSPTPLHLSSLPCSWILNCYQNVKDFYFYLHSSYIFIHFLFISIASSKEAGYIEDTWHF